MWLGNSQLNLGPTPTLWVGTDWGFQNQHVDPAHSAGCSSPLAPDEPRHPPCLLTVHVVLGGSGTRMDSIFHRKENNSGLLFPHTGFRLRVRRRAASQASQGPISHPDFSWSPHLSHQDIQGNENRECQWFLGIFHACLLLLSGKNRILENQQVHTNKIAKGKKHSAVFNEHNYTCLCQK